MGDVERERAHWRQWCIDIVRAALWELPVDPTDEDIAAWFDRREAGTNPIPGESVDGEKLPF